MSSTVELDGWPLSPGKRETIPSATDTLASQANAPLPARKERRRIMPTEEVICPACSSRLQRPASLRQGDLLECPMCATEFTLGGRDQRLTNRPRPRPVEDEEGEGREVDLEIVEDDEDRSRRRRRRVRRAQSGAVELTRWIGLGFTHWLPMLPPSIGFFFLYLLCYIGVSIVIGCLGIFLVRAAPVLGRLITTLMLLSIMVPLS